MSAPLPSLPQYDNLYKHMTIKEEIDKIDSSTINSISENDTFFFLAMPDKNKLVDSEKILTKDFTTDSQNPKKLLKDVLEKHKENFKNADQIVKTLKQSSDILKGITATNIQDKTTALLKLPVILSTEEEIKAELDDIEKSKIYENTRTTIKSHYDTLATVKIDIKKSLMNIKPPTKIEIDAPINPTTFLSKYKTSIDQYSKEFDNLNKSIINNYNVIEELIENVTTIYNEVQSNLSKFSPGLQTEVQTVYKMFNETWNLVPPDIGIFGILGINKNKKSIILDYIKYDKKIIDRTIQDFDKITIHDLTLMMKYTEIQNSPIDPLPGGDNFDNTFYDSYDSNIIKKIEAYYNEINITTASDKGLSYKTKEEIDSIYKNKLLELTTLQFNFYNLNSKIILYRSIMKLYEEKKKTPQ
jgi:hypothetical protein